MVVSYCSGSAPGSRHISHLIRNSWRQTTRYVKQIFSLRTSSCIPEDTPSEKSTTMMILVLPRNLLPLLPKASPLQGQSFPSRARRSHHPTSFISTYIHGIRYVARSSHVSNVATTPTSAQTITDGSRNYSRNQGHNLSRYERIATCRSCGYWNPHDPHC